MKKEAPFRFTFIELAIYLVLLSMFVALICAGLKVTEERDTSFEDLITHSQAGR